MPADTLLIELFVEELPPKALETLGKVFADTVFARLDASGLIEPTSAVTAYATPRRLAVQVSAVRDRAPDQSVADKLMPVRVGLDADGQPTAALAKKLAALGLDVSVVPALRRAHDGKQDVLFHDHVAPGATLADGVCDALEAALSALPIPKVMSYQLADGWETVHFVRPVHGLVVLHGSAVVPVSVLGHAAGNRTSGHRFEARTKPVVIPHADQYESVLAEQGAVIASFAGRRALIAAQLAAAAAAAGEGLSVVDDAALLDEVTALVERPNVLTGTFEPAFLEVPQECLILTMKANQKYFPLVDASGRLTNRFLIVSNLTPDDPSAIIGGNERVVRPRLADARFFYEQDRKRPLASRVDALDKVVYHNRLGSQGERVKRVARIAEAFGDVIGGSVLAGQARRAAELAKADLVTEMVGEFPELQGIMGRYYALNDGLDVAVADAIEDHYKPRFAGDDLPRGDAGMVLALADKFETLCGLFGIGQLPSGDKDPFALRRHALGVIRMLMTRDDAPALDWLLAKASMAFDEVDDFVDPSVALSEFIFERLAGVLRDQGFTAHEIDAVLALMPQQLSDVPRRLAAVRAFGELDESQSLAAANKRVANILRKAQIDGEPAVDVSRFERDAEHELHAQLKAVSASADAAFDRGDYTGSLRALADLRAPVDRFFDDVMVNVDDDAVRLNRLALLAALHGAMNQVADLSRLSV